MASPHPDAPPVELSFLGPLRAAVAGAPAVLGGPRQRSVLARLAVAGGDVVSTDRIVDDLWDGEPPPKALASLQVHVSHLRRALEPGRRTRSEATVLVSRAPGYALHLPREAVDAWRFADLVARAQGEAGAAARRELLERALACWRGPAYAEVADTAWAAPEVARLDELRLTALEARAEADLDLGRAGAVVPELDRLVREHPGRERAVRLLALALYRGGRQGDALAVLRRAREHLADELGVDPGRELRELEAAVLAQDPALDAPAAVVPAVPVAPPAPEPAPPSIGRTAELRRLLAAAGEARSGARVVWIGGEAGAGKTTLVEAATGELRRRGWRTAWGRCPEVEGAPPAWPWSEVLRELDDAALPEDGNPFRLARSVADQLAAAAGGAPLLVVLDDVHRADDLTLQLLRQVVGGLAGRPVLVLATYRTTEDGEALAATRAALATATAAHLALGGLDAAGVAVLARANGLEQPDGDVVALLRERTGGNPLFVRELTRLIVSEGAAAARAGVPVGVREVLRRRVERLPGPAVTALRQAAVLGRETDVDLLAAVTGHDPDELLDALETAVLAGLLVEPAPGQVRFSHALVRDTLYEDLPLMRRARVHATALAALEARGADATTLAHHAVAAAGPTTAADAVPYVVAAAREAEQLGAHADAARQWATALRVHELVGARVGGDEALLALLLPSIPAHARAGNAVVAREQQRLAVRAAARLGRRDLHVAALAAWDAPLVWTVRDDGAQDPELLDPLLALLETPAGGDLPDDVRARLWVALFREVEGVDDVRAERASAEALTLARRVPGEPRLLCLALNARAYAALGPDLADRREELAEELLAVATAAGAPDHQAVAHWLLFLAASARTDLALARRHGDRAVALSGSGQLGHVLGALGVHTGALLVLAGRVDEGRARYEEIATRLAETGQTNGGLMALIGRFVAGFARGDLSSSVADMEWLDTAMPGALSDAVVLTFLDAGRGADARAVWARRRPIARDYYWLTTTTLRAHAAVRLGDVGAAVAAREELLPWAGRVAGLDSGTLVLGPVDDALAEVAGLLGDVDAAAAHRAAAAEVRRRLAAELAAVGL
ncbi:transcriptional regulator [Blastococcus sp. MG754426]|uniref:BTAD domain-containing putative transcriptional regulator n=1 Tax=unclassified Blastococcus TaxID=2619396 RepID=UPI001EF05261|nr:MULTISPECIES: BTAD domain-containing putative transcriptional regulator [unclassified Blastococcus]MCF6509918.1 transcriptional regulator [Blastococcus sp. MG754426]MCF6514214.1 transcriptional regulator [Blastococcus sp. MG754427]MCF6737366.1 transcriptional regulator [Blastococcus sp. KM273129]